MEWNKYQSTIEELNLDSYPDEVVNEFYEFINTVPFIRNLISKDRPLCKDVPRDENGRAIIDLTNPPIIEDVDYFRQSAIRYQKTGRYTDLRPNPNPNSEYGKWNKQEVMRCWYGMVRPEDGAWVSGDMYFFLNYSPIVQSKIRKGTKVADRVIDFPEWWEGIYYRSVYQEMARNNAHHCAEIAKRGAGKSFWSASQLSRNFILGENYENQRSVRSMVMAYQKEYLTKDGTLNKFSDMRDFLAKSTQWPHKTLTKSLDKMQWRIGEIDLNTGAEIGTKNEVLGISSKDDPDKGRGKRPQPLDTKVLTPKGFVELGDIKVGDIVYGKDGNKTKVLAIQDYDDGDIYRIRLIDGRITYAEGNHLFPIIYRSAGKLKEELRHIKDIAEKTTWINKDGETTYKFSIPKNNCVLFDETPLPIDAYVMGLYLGDGCYRESNNNRLNITMLRKDIDDIERFIPYKVEKSKYRDITHFIAIKNSKLILDSLGLKNKRYDNKFIPECYLFNSEDNRIKLLNGLLDSDGACSKDYGTIEYSTKSIKLSDDFLFLCRSLGFNATKKIKIVNDNVYYRCYVYSDDKRLFNLSRKKNNLNPKLSAYADRCVIKTVEFSRKDKCRCITVDNKDGLYLTDDFIVTHNSSRIIIEEFGNFPKIIDTYRVMLPSVQEGDIVFGQMSLVGTGGSEGNDFAGAQEILFNPLGYNIQEIPNVYDKSQQGKGSCIFFFPAYLNRKGCYNKDGISDVPKALLEICNNRYLVKYNSTDPMALTRTKAENPVTLQEAIMRRDSTIFPVAAIMDRIEQIKNEPTFYDDILSGDLVMKQDGKITCVPSTIMPIRHFPHKDNKLEGCVEIFKLPEYDSNGKPMSNRYISGVDPYDDDSSKTMSLGSIFIFDLFTDEIVAEYTGRPTFAEDFYEVCRKLLLMYNARCNYENDKKGLFSYFSKMNCIYLLTDTLEFLKDKDDTVGNIVTNKSKGTKATQFVNNYGRRLIRDWLLKPTNIITSVNGEDVETTVPSLMKIRNIALLQELSQWNPDGNFDRVSAMGMLMLLREDKLRILGPQGVQMDKFDNGDNLANDEFFTKNFGDIPDVN